MELKFDRVIMAFSIYRAARALIGRGLYVIFNNYSPKAK